MPALAPGYMTTSVLVPKVAHLIHAAACVKDERKGRPVFVSLRVDPNGRLENVMVRPFLTLASLRIVHRGKQQLDSANEAREVAIRLRINPPERELLELLSERARVE